jgi:hypothetical protein
MVGSGIRKKHIPDPGSRGQKGPGSATLVFGFRLFSTCIHIIIWYSYKTSFHKTSRHETSSHKTSRLQNVLAYQTSRLQNVLVYKTSSSTKRHRLQNVPPSKGPRLQNVLAYKMSSSTKRPSLSLGSAAIHIVNQAILAWSVNIFSAVN